MCLCTMLLKYALSIPTTFKKATNPVAFSAGTWYNNNNKDPGKIAETSRGEKRETQTIANWRRGFQAAGGQRVLLC